MSSATESPRGARLESATRDYLPYLAEIDKWGERRADVIGSEHPGLEGSEPYAWLIAALAPFGGLAPFRYPQSPD